MTGTIIPEIFEIFLDKPLVKCYNLVTEVIFDYTAPPKYRPCRENLSRIGDFLIARIKVIALRALALLVCVGASFGVAGAVRADRLSTAETASPESEVSSKSSYSAKKTGISEARVSSEVEAEAAESALSSAPDSEIPPECLIPEAPVSSEQPAPPAETPVVPSVEATPEPPVESQPAPAEPPAPAPSEPSVEPPVSSYTEPQPAPPEVYYTPWEFKYKGVIRWNDWRWTWYSEKVLPGRGLKIPGRHNDENGYVCDGDGYICLSSSDLPRGTVLDTPFGKQGKIYDTGCPHGTIDVYVAW